VGGAVTRSRLGPDRGRCPEPSVCHASFQPLAVGRAQERAEFHFSRFFDIDNPLCWTARAEASGLLQSIVSPQDMRKVVNEVLRELGPLLAGRDVSIVDFLPPANCDFRMIVGVVNELLTNAVKYAPPRSPLEISVEQLEARQSHG
jgi:signal transduction histidine kinase